MGISLRKKKVVVQKEELPKKEDELYAEYISRMSANTRYNKAHEYIEKKIKLKLNIAVEKGWSDIIIFYTKEDFEEFLLDLPLVRQNIINMLEKMGFKKVRFEDNIFTFEFP